MAKNNKKPTKEPAEIEKSEEVLSVKKIDKKSKDSNVSKVKDKKSKIKNKKNDKPKRNFVKEIVSELKKVNWPTFKNACKQTGSVLVVVAAFMFAVLGIDSLVSLILRLITKI